MTFDISERMSKDGIFNISISSLASKHGIKPLKKFGQNFIFDESLCDKIVNYAYENEISDLKLAQPVLEIGPGPAGLTRSILKIGVERLVVVETDHRCIPLLEEIKTSYNNLEIIHADALKLNLAELLPGALASGTNPTKIKIISNLPYNIGTVLLLSWLKNIEYVSSMTLMLQKEVVDRIISSPSSKSYGILSIIAQSLCEVKKCFDVSPKAFYPAPKVWSSIVHLKPLDNRIDPQVLKALEIITSLAFSGKRKMIKSSLKIIPKAIGLDEKLQINIEEILQKNDIDPCLRAENIPISDYLKLAIYVVSLQEC